MIQRIRNFVRNEDGPTAVEYAVMVALIAVAIIATVQALGGTMNAKFGEVSSKISGV